MQRGMRTSNRIMTNCNIPPQRIISATSMRPAVSSAAQVREAVTAPGGLDRCLNVQYSLTQEFFLWLLLWIGEG